MPRTARWDTTRDKPVRAKGSWGNTPRQGAPDRTRLIVGRYDGYVHRTFMRFAFDESDVGTLLKAELVIKLASGDLTPGANASVTVARLLDEFNEGSGAGWQNDEAVNPSVVTTRTSHKSFPGSSAGDVIRIDITPMVGPWLATSKQWMDGTSTRGGANKPAHGLRLKTKEETGTGSYAFGFHSREATDAENRPYIEITYEPPNYAPDLFTTITPNGTVVPNVPFTGEYGDPNGDRPENIELVVRRADNDNTVWAPPKFKFDSQWLETGGIWSWSIENPGSAVLRSGIDYEWRARGFDAGGKASAWTSWRGFRQEGTAPTVTLRPTGTLETLSGYDFKADWVVAPTAEVASYRAMLKDTADLWSTPLWDHTFLPLTETERLAGHLIFPYLGPRLPAGDYDLRVLVVDSRGTSSEWSAEDTFSLTVGSEPDQDSGDDYLPPNLTAYNKARTRVRIVLRDLDPATRGPGTIKAIIEDASNIGMSAVVNEPGEFFFTLPALHPQAGECEPWQRHFALQQYRNGTWVDIHNGLLTDFDAGDNDIIVYGYDYLGVLAKAVDTRFPPPGDVNLEHSEGGAKYRDEKISDIVWEQLNTARNAVDSPTKFFHQGVWQELNTRVSIYSSFKAVLPFIRGLLESHRQGTGKRTRLKARKDPSQSNRWEWDLRNNAGTDRDNLRLEYGSVLQNFRVIAMGEDYATRMHGVGTEPNSVKPRYYVSPAVGASDFLTQTFGSLQRVEVYDDIIDMNDLKRRVKQALKSSSKVGKRISLAIRVHGILPYDGYDLADNVPLDIDRGMVETDRYGSGYWTIWGIEYRVFPDGHDELTWAILPREDDEDPDPDLLPSDPIHAVPPQVTGLTVAPAYAAHIDGTAAPRLAVAWTAMSTDDEPELAGYTIQWDEGSYDEENAYVPPDWTDPQTLDVFSPDEASILISDIVAGSTYDVRVRAFTPDFVGEWSAVASEVAAPIDTSAPEIPDADIAAGYRSLGVWWSPNTEPDISIYGVRYRAVGAEDWMLIRTKSSRVIIDGLEPVEHEAQVRAIDRTGLVRTSDVDDTAVEADEEPEAGWSPLVTATPTLVGQSDVVFSGVIADIVSANSINADAIASGSLRVGGPNADGIRVFDSEGRQIGAWGEWGHIVADPLNPDSAVFTGRDPSSGEFGTFFTDAYGWSGQNEDPIEDNIATAPWQAAITPRGVHADAIKLGPQQGGSNRMQNAGMELAEWVVAGTLASKEWTLTTDWDDATSTVNLDTTTGDLKMTAV